MNLTFKSVVFFALITISFPVWKTVEKYLWYESGFVMLLAVLISADTALAVIYHIANGTFRIRKFSNVWVKVCVIAVILNVTHFLRKNNSFTAEQIESVKFLIENLDYFSYNWIVIREILSINKNASLLGYPLFPAIISEKLEEFLKKTIKISNQKHGKSDDVPDS